MTRLTDIHGIGPAMAKRLEAAGIVDGKTLAEASLALLSAIPGVSALRATTWQKTAADTALTAPSDIPTDQPDTTVVVFAVPSADTAPVNDAPVEPSEPKAKAKAKAKAKKKPAKGKKKDDKAKSKKAEKLAKPKKAEKPAKKAEKSKKAAAKAKKTETKKKASAKKKSADKAKADKAKKTKAKSKKKAKAA